MTTFTQDQWIILALVFILGLLVGAFMTAGGRKKWKTRYHDEREQHWAAQEKDWRERDSLRAAAVKDRRDVDDERPL